jgi:hypothetical protein
VEKYYIWVEVTAAGAAEVKHGIDPTASGWASWPANDGKHALLGWVDTHTKKDEFFPLIRQIVRADLLPIGTQMSVCVAGAAQTWLVDGITQSFA